jgi:hypothetical protein
MKRCAGILVLAGLALLLAAGFAAAEPVTDRILVTFEDPGMSNSARAGPVRPGYNRRVSSYLVSIGVRHAARGIAREFGLRALDEWPIQPLNVHCIVYAIDDDRDVDELLERLREDPRVESAQRMKAFEVLGTAADASMALGELQHSAVSLELEAAHRWSRGEGAHVVIVDTGADIAHPEIRAQVEAHRNFVDKSAADFNADAHGTAIAGIIGASADDGAGIIGVAPSAAITVLKACWYTDRQRPAVCNSFTLARALSFAIESGARVINLSLSGPADPLLARLVAAAVDGGQIVIAAAPTAASGASFPATLPGVIAVDAAETTAPETRASVRAPGSDILVPVPGGEFGFASGSSLSAAHVSGVVALLVASRPQLSQDAVRALLISAENPDSRSVSACRALALLMEREGCPAPRPVSAHRP